MITVNAMGENCPIPVIKTKKAMQEITGADSITVLVDNEIAAANVTKMAAASGAISVVSEKMGEQEYKVLIQVGQASEKDANHTKCGKDEKAQSIVAIASDRMGEGNDALGKVLLKGFIFAITQLDTLPSAVLFYNGGATLTAEGSDSIEDLKGLEEQGVEILTCGTCLNYYELADKLLVGSVTNMYTIVEKMAQASSIIRP